MTEFTCENCKHRRLNPKTKHWYCALTCADLEHCKPCSFFATKDGKRPRFCRLASSVDEMAEAFVVKKYDCAGEAYWGLGFCSLAFQAYADALAAAKAWLSEVEE